MSAHRDALDRELVRKAGVHAARPISTEACLAEHECISRLIDKLRRGGRPSVLYLGQLLRRTSGAEAAVEEQVVDDLEAPRDDEGGAGEG